MWNRSISLELLHLLGEGGQGSVFKALRRDRQAKLEQVVAVKILNSQTSVDVWRLEFESLARVRSRYCVQVLSFERYRGRPALILEFIDGISLAHFTQTHPPSSAMTHELICQLELALKDLHSQGVLHGDLSPQNILIDREGQIRLLDFGLANCSEQLLRLTPKFAAPERLEGKPATPSADLYSLGRIQEFLGDDSPSESYLHPEPSKRRFRNLEPNSEAQATLASCVDRILTIRENSQAGITECFSIQNSRPKSRRAVGLAIVTSLIMLTTSAVSRSNRLDSSMAALSVRTDKWHYLILDNKSLGYAPIRIPLTANRKYLLTWISAHDRGVIHLHPKENETLQLRDSDFSH